MELTRHATNHESGKQAEQRRQYLTELSQQADVALLSSEDMWGLRAAADTIAATGHEWDEDPASWVRQQRHGDVRRGG